MATDRDSRLESGLQALSNTDEVLDDHGFTERVMSRLPVSMARAGFARQFVLLITITVCLVLLANVLPVREAFAEIDMTSFEPITLSLVSLLSLTCGLVLVKEIVFGR